jgi:serine/threonine protein phosphatase 1
MLELPDRRERSLARVALASRARKTKPRVPENIRIYAVGDIHGCADLLSALLKRIDYDLKTRPVAQALQVFLGDYIDRGPDSRRVLDLLIGRRHRHKAVFLKGNHELYAFEALTDPSVLAKWIKIGGIPTLASYGIKASRRNNPQSAQDMAQAFSKVIPESHRRFLGGLALSFSCGDFFFTHAGVRPGVPLQKQSEDDLLWIREDFLLHEGDFGMVVVHGHTPAIEPDVRENRINIDTGAYATGRLTCLVLEGDQITFL